MELSVAKSGPYQFEQVGQFESKIDGQSLRVVGNRADKPVVVTEQIIVQTFGIRVRFERFNGTCEEQIKGLLFISMELWRN